MSASRIDALRLLGRRDFTTAELEKRLLARGFPPEDVQETLSALATEGVLDDRRVAAAHIRTSGRVKHRGRQRIRLELESRGVDAALIRELLAELPAEEERGAIDEFLRRRRVPPHLTLDERRRVFQQLLRRGFAAEAIARALRDRGEDE
jgi:regulatory protein